MRSVIRHYCKTFYRVFLTLSIILHRMLSYHTLQISSVNITFIYDLNYNINQRINSYFKFYDFLNYIMYSGIPLIHVVTYFVYEIKFLSLLSMLTNLCFCHFILFLVFTNILWGISTFFTLRKILNLIISLFS